MRNHQTGRREFIGLAGAGISSFVGASWPRSAGEGEGTKVNLAVLNSNVYTVDQHTPKREAFVVKAGYGVTSVHHGSGNLAALQQVRVRGDLLHCVSYEANGALDAVS